MCKSQPTWPVHLSGWHHCTHTPSISAWRHRTMLLPVINIHTSLAALHSPSSSERSHAAAATAAAPHTHTRKQTNNSPRALCYAQPSSSLIHTVAACSVPWHSHLLFHTLMAGAQGTHPVKVKLCDWSTLFLLFLGSTSTLLILVLLPVSSVPLYTFF